MQLSILAAATHLGISADTVRRRIKAGRIDAHKQDGRWMVEVAGDNGARATLIPEDDQRALVELLQAQLAVKDQQIERLHVLLAQTALPAATARPWWQFWR